MDNSSNSCNFAYKGKPTLDAHLQFEINVYQFCDNNVGKKVVFPVFMSMWPYEKVEVESYEESYFLNKDGKPEISERTISTKDIATITNRIVAELIRLKIIKEVPPPVRRKSKDHYLVSYVDVPYFTIYPCYKILPHSPLIERKRR